MTDAPAGPDRAHLYRTYRVSCRRRRRRRLVGSCQGSWRVRAWNRCGSSRCICMGMRWPRLSCGLTSLWGARKALTSSASSAAWAIPCFRGAPVQSKVEALGSCVWCQPSWALGRERGVDLRGGRGTVVSAPACDAAARLPTSCRQDASLPPTRRRRDADRSGFRAGTGVDRCLPRSYMHHNTGL